MRYFPPFCYNIRTPHQRHQTYSELPLRRALFLWKINKKISGTPINISKIGYKVYDHEQFEFQKLVPSTTK